MRMFLLRDKHDLKRLSFYIRLQPLRIEAWLRLLTVDCASEGILPQDRTKRDALTPMGHGSLSHKYPIIHYTGEKPLEGARTQRRAYLCNEDSMGWRIFPVKRLLKGVYTRRIII
ncbi:hypothetical protein CHS0354_033557 [Potamilus streckersoni]|uniref:Uncharacterized protein n=1 Tax=Potamilus streckersoni TaxID=2493646 RepID=A0AAE0T0G5_9BIVA|nr:hypothetical protein CHS0354_033557 [Potamilus streckersoni]